MSNLTETLGVALVGVSLATGALAQFAEINVPPTPTVAVMDVERTPALKPAPAVVAARVELPAIRASGSR